MFSSSLQKKKNIPHSYKRVFSVFLFIENYSSYIINKTTKFRAMSNSGKEIKSINATGTSSNVMYKQQFTTIKPSSNTREEQQLIFAIFP